MTVDIIIPCYNVGKFIDRCMESLFSQTFSGWRALCINDGSTDDTLERLQAYAAKDSRIVVRDFPNGGVSRARNRGIELVEADFVYFLDADDFIHPQTLELAVTMMERDGSDMFTFYRKSDYRNVQVRIRRLLGLDTIRWMPRSYRRRYDLEKVDTVRTDDVLTHCSCSSRHRIPWPVKHTYAMLQICRSELVREVRMPDILIEDLPWWSELILTPRSATISKLPLYYYYPNRFSVINTIKRVRKSASMLDGLVYARNLYREKATPERFAIWRRQIMWPMLGHLSKRVDRLRSAEDRQAMAGKVQYAASQGLFDICDTPCDDATKTKLLNFR